MENGGAYKVAVIGSGNWGSVATKIIASNTIKQNIFHGNLFYFLFFFPEKSCHLFIIKSSSSYQFNVVVSLSFIFLYK
jgi:hypothetical protein